MTFGIYIVGDDAVLHHVKALVNSLRYHSPDLRIVLIPYSERYAKALEATKVELFKNLDFLSMLDEKLKEVLSQPGAPPQANKYPRLRNLAAFFGEFSEFIVLDADIVVMTDLNIFRLQYRKSLFGCYDRTYLHNGKWVFSEKAKEVFSPEQFKRIFNSGFWYAKKFLPMSRLFALLEECKTRYDLFDFPNGVITQPIFNYIILNTVKTDKFLNPLLLNRAPEPWAGFKYEIKDLLLYRKDIPLPFLHWAGKEISEKNPYYSLWKAYYEMSF